jgi:hypothetical protein
MKRIVAGFISLGLVTMLGCNSSTPGGPGVAATPNASGTTNTTVTTYKPSLGEADDSFSLSGPLLSTHLKQGETTSLKIKISRGRNFQDDVKLKFAALPGGVTVESINPMISHSTSEATVEFRASNEAAPGTYTVSVIGQPTTGPDGKSDFQITVDSTSDK